MTDSQINPSLFSNPNSEVQASIANASKRMAYESVAAELAAIPDDELVRLNVDPTTAVTTILLRLPRLRSLRAAWLEQLPRVDIAHLDRLGDFARALAYTHARVSVLERTASELPEEYEQALAQREALLSTAKALAAYGRLDAARFERVGLDRGYRNVAYDLSALADLFREDWPRIGDHCPFDYAEVERAEARSDRMLEGSVERERTPGVTAPRLKERQRAYTALSRVYNDVRRAVSFLRWNEGDASDFAPALVSGGRGASRSHSNRSDEPAETLAPATGVPTGEAGADALDDDDDTHGRDSLFAIPGDI